MLRNLMDLYIETLTGTAFELRVSPFETVMSVKAKIQRHEGIPITQQHLIWQAMELDDDYCLHDYSIPDGATLKLVLAMRGGPINTRRIPMEDPALREMAEYMEANHDELIDKLPGNRQVTLLVYREGDQLNFFRVVDRGDGTLTPLSESLSRNSIYNLCDEEEDEGNTGVKEHVEENDKMKEKMKIIRTKMENLTLHKAKPKKKPPLVPRQQPSSRPTSRTRLQHLSNSLKPLTLPHKHVPLPPLRRTVATVVSQPSPPLLAAAPLTAPPGVPPSLSSSEDSSGHLSASSIKGKEPFDSAKSLLSRLPSVQEDQPTSTCKQLKLSPPLVTVPEPDSLEKLLRQAKQSSGFRREDREPTQDVKEPSRPRPSSQKKDITLDSLKESLSMQQVSMPERSGLVTSGTALGKEKVMEARGRPPTSSKYSSSMERKQGLVLESLSHTEARGLLRQASLERLGSSQISMYLHSASKSRSGYTGQGRISTPEGRMVSARLQCLSSREGRVTPTRLPPVKQKKKSKRCYMCSKKTGLATSYQCRCGHNFCATHRYAEAHNCTFDYKTEGRKLLEQSNPVVTAPKLPKI